MKILDSLSVDNLEAFCPKAVADLKRGGSMLDAILSLRTTKTDPDNRIGLAEAKQALLDFAYARKIPFKFFELEYEGD